MKHEDETMIWELVKIPTRLDVKSRKQRESHELSSSFYAHGKWSVIRRPDNLTSFTKSVTLMKPQRLVGACFSVMLFGVTLGCSANNTATTFQNSSVTKRADEQVAKTFDCRNQNEYRFVVIENPNRKKDSDPVIPKDLNIVVKDEVISKIELPKESEAKNFSLKSVESTETGFKIKVEWGGGLYRYENQFNFTCKDNNFYLDEVRKESFSTTNPDSGNFWDKKESEVTKIEPSLPIEKFVMTDYL